MKRNLIFRTSQYLLCALCLYEAITVSRGPFIRYFVYVTFVEIFCIILFNIPDTRVLWCCYVAKTLDIFNYILVLSVNVSYLSIYLSNFTSSFPNFVHCCTLACHKNSQMKTQVNFAHLNSVYYIYFFFKQTSFLHGISHSTFKSDTVANHRILIGIYRVIK